MRVIRQRFAMLVANVDTVVIEADAGVGDRDAEDVAGETIEHRLLALRPQGVHCTTHGFDQTASGRTRSGRLFCNPALGCRARAWP